MSAILAVALDLWFVWVGVAAVLVAMYLGSNTYEGANDERRQR